eukprot:8692247-Pyramimonas_sp.AAC.1
MAYFHKAMELGEGHCADADLGLAYAYEHGLGVPRDLVAAKTHYNNAGLMGCLDALLKLGSIHSCVKAEVQEAAEKFIHKEVSTGVDASKLKLDTLEVDLPSC